VTLRATHRHPRAKDYRRAGGAWDVPTLDALLSGLDPSVAGRPARVTLVDGEVRLTSTALDDLVARLAGGLRDAGVRRHHVVAWQLPNSYEAIVLYRACWRLGAIAAPLHHQAGSDDVAKLVARLDPKVVVSAAHLAAARHPGAVIVGGPTLPGRRGPDDDAPPNVGNGSKGAGRTFAALLDATPEEPHGQARPTDIAVVLFTAGSSGQPKGVMHTHRTLAYKTWLMPGVHGLDPTDSVLMPAPLAHISGLLNGLLVPTVAGMKSVVMPRWNTELALDLIERERITFMVGPPTFFIGLMDDPDFTTHRVRSLRLISTGGTGVNPAFVERARHELGANVKRSYGSTEAPTVATSGPDADIGQSSFTDGRAIGDAELRLVDGELQVRGPELFVGYLDESETEAAFERGGWFRTGDFATIDPEGWLTVTGRLNDVIIRGGENISVTRVEAVLEDHPDVRQAAVVGEPDDRLGERITAFVVVADGTTFDLAASRAWFAEQGMAKFMWPERIEAVAELPKLESGKIDKPTLKTRLF
jgi:cyclohexanecarboxylate-CoA ligase